MRLPPLTDDNDLPEFQAVIKSTNGVKAQGHRVVSPRVTWPRESLTASHY